MACSSRARCCARSASCACGAPQLAARGEHVALRRDADLVSVLGDRQGELVGRGGFVEQPLFLVELAQADVVERQLALRRQEGVGAIGGACLGGGLGALDRAPDAAEEVGRPAGAEPEVVALQRSAKLRPPEAPAPALTATVGNKGGALNADQGAGLPPGGVGGEDALVSDRRAVLQIVQPRVAERRPPVEARRRGVETRRRRRQRRPPCRRPASAPAADDSSGPTRQAGAGRQAAGRCTWPIGLSRRRRSRHAAAALGEARCGAAARAAGRDRDRRPASSAG